MSGKPFTCPRCGGFKWGTSNIVADQTQWIGHCEGGKGYVGCGFKWNRARDDINLLGEPLIEGYMAPRISLFARLRFCANLVFMGKYDPPL